MTVNKKKSEIELHNSLL